MVHENDLEESTSRNIVLESLLCNYYYCYNSIVCISQNTKSLEDEKQNYKEKLEKERNECKEHKKYTHKELERCDKRFENE